MIKVGKWQKEEDTVGFSNPKLRYKVEISALKSNSVIP